MSLGQTKHWNPVETVRSRKAAGVSLVGTGAVLILGVITAEALFPGYSTAEQTISALGAARGTPASRAIFNPALVVAGLLMLVAAYGLHRSYDSRPLTALLAIAGAGTVGAALFPSQTGLLHGLAALLVFVGFGLTALVAAAVVPGTFGYVSGTFGVLELVTLVLWTAIHPPSGSVHGLGSLLTFVGVGIGALVVATVIGGVFRYVSAALGILVLLSFIFLIASYPPGSSVPDVTSLGVGGLERWVTYLAVVWLTAFGGYLLADGSNEVRDGSENASEEVRGEAGSIEN